MTYSDCSAPTLTFRYKQASTGLPTWTRTFALLIEHGSKSVPASVPRKNYLKIKS